MDAFQKNGLTELELTEDSFNLKLKREVVTGVVTTVAPPAVSQGPLPISNSGMAQPEKEQPEETLDENLTIIESPIIGTFYRAPNPDADPYISVGDVIRKGQVLCIIEAMKIMNEIESEMEGTVVKIFPQNGEAVEYGQKLFAVKPV